jgi:hypothetical protein
MKFDLILNRIIPGLSSTKAAKPVDRFRGLSPLFRVLGFEFFQGSNDLGKMCLRKPATGLFLFLIGLGLI